MKRFTPLVFLVVFVSFMSGAWADKPRWQHRERTVIKLETHGGGYRHGYGGGYRHGHSGYRDGHRGSGWSPLATVAILGSAVYWANTYSQPSVTTVVVTPSVVYSHQGWRIFARPASSITRSFRCVRCLGKW